MPWNLVLNRLLLTAAGVALLGACSSTPDKPKAAELPPLPATAANSPFTQVWKNTVGVMATPLSLWAQGGLVAAASSDGVVALIDAATGRDVWRLALNTPVQTGVGGDGTRFALVTQGNEVIAVQAGQVIWRYRLNASTYTAPLVAGGRVFVLTADRTVIALDGASGQRLWSQQRAGDPLVLRQDGLLMAVGDTLVTGMSGRLMGLNPSNGTTRWESVVGASRGTNEVERLVDIVAGVSRVGSVVCARSFQTAVACVDAAKGGTLWSRASVGHQGLSGNEEQVIGVESDSKITAWSRATGQPGWTSDALRFRGLSAPWVSGHTAVVGDEGGLLHRLSLADGKTLNRVATDGSAIAAQPVAAAGLMVVATKSGGLFGYRLD
jgi:outer membrane assembly lipoprotein YfgL